MPHGGPGAGGEGDLSRARTTTGGRQLVISGPQPGSELAWQGVFVPSTPGGAIFSAVDRPRDHQVPGPAGRRAPPDYTPGDFRSTRRPSRRSRRCTPSTMRPILTSRRSRPAGGKLLLYHGWSDPPHLAAQHGGLLHGDAAPDG